MSKLTSPAVLEILNDYRWRLVESFEFWLTDSPEDVINVPAGYVTDLASGQCSRHTVVTRKLPSFMTGCMRTAADEKDGDRIFLDGMGVLGVPRWRRLTGTAHGVNVQSKGRQPQMWLSFQSLVRS